VRWIVLFIGMAVSVALVAQEAPKKKRKPASKEQSAKQVRGKPTPEQIRRFNELQKKKK
jgi:hypothetical protein